MSVRASINVYDSFLAGNENEVGSSNERSKGESWLKGDGES